MAAHTREDLLISIPQYFSGLFTVIIVTRCSFRTVDDRE